MTPQDHLDGALVLLVEDDDGTRGLVRRALEESGCRVTAVASAAEAQAALPADAATLVVLDVGLGDASGLELCRTWRAEGKRHPVLMLTAWTGVGARVAGLDAGADDYLGKPFAVAELRARLRALRRRLPRRAEERTWVHGTLVLDLARRRAGRAGKELALTRREWEVIERLAAAAGHAVTRTGLLEDVWGEETPEAAASLEVIVARLRRKLGEAADGGLVRTVRGTGYALEGGPARSA